MKKNSWIVWIFWIIKLILTKYRQYKQKTALSKNYPKYPKTIQLSKISTIQVILCRGRPFFKMFPTPMKSKQNTGLYAFILQFRGLYDGK